jgi:hypothetical protein
MKLDEARQIAMSVPEVTEEPHSGAVAKILPFTRNDADSWAI